MCSQCLSHTGPAPTHGTHSSGSRLLFREPSEAGPGLHAPRSKLLRLRHSGSPQRRRLGWACILCPSQVQAAQVTRCLASAVHATYCLSRPCRSGFLGVQLAHLLRRMLTVWNPKKSWLAMKPACSLVDNACLGATIAPFRLWLPSPAWRGKGWSVAS